MNTSYTARKIDIDNELWKKVSVTAAAVGISKKQVVEQALRNHFAMNLYDISKLK